MSGILCLLFLFSGCSPKEENRPPAESVVSGPKLDTHVVENGVETVLKYYRNDTLVGEKELFADKERRFYPSGQLEEEYIYEGGEYEFTYTRYHPNGKKQTRAKQVIFHGCGVESGEHLEWDDAGNLVLRQSTELFLPEPDAGCHDMRIIKHLQEYYPGEKLKKDHWIESCYECIECPCGEIVEYDEAGKEIARSRHGDCYDYQMDCEDE